MPRRQYLVTAALIRRDDQLLLVQQQGLTDPAPTWALPGGVVEAGELLTEALIREVREETGLVVTEIGALAYVTQLVNLSSDTQSLAFVFEITAWSGINSPDDPDKVILDVGFYNIADAVAKIQMLPRLMMREPLVAYLGGESPRGTVWLYRQEHEGSQQLIATIPGTQS